MKHTISFDNNATDYGFNFEDEITLARLGSTALFDKLLYECQFKTNNYVTDNQLGEDEYEISQTLKISLSKDDERRIRFSMEVNH